MTDQTAVTTRQPIDIDFSHGIVPGSYTEAMQMSALLHKSRLAPKSLDTVEKVAIAVLMCIELGRPIVTGIQDLAVINGKCTIFGDAALALVRASGLLEKFEEGEKGTPFTPEWTFFCKMKRKGFPEKTGTWSWQDSIRAGHDKIGPPSPWAKYTRRMMQFKARNFIMRDEFGDVLKGIKTQEEAYDSIDLAPDVNGSWGNPEPKPEQQEPGVKDPEPSFEDVIVKPSGLPAEAVGEFVALTAQGNDMPGDAVKVEAMKFPVGFMAALKKWAKKQLETMQPESPEEAIPVEPAKGEEQPTAEDGDMDPIRAEFVNLRANFSTWFYKNKSRIVTFSEAIQEEIKDKWERMHPDVPYPLNEATGVEDDSQEDEPPAVVNGPRNIWCPESDGWKPVAVCEKCEKSEKCQKYQEWGYEKAEDA